jgi:hypothetical protein
MALSDFSKRSEIKPSRINPAIHEINKRMTIVGDEILLVNETPNGTVISLSIDALTRRLGFGNAGFFANITASALETGTAKRVYTWAEVGGSRTGAKAYDVYSGLLSLVGETVLMILGGDGMYRFCFDRTWEGVIHECGTGWAKIEDPGEVTNLITVDKTAGFYAVNDGVLLAAEGAGGWTIVDRIPMAMYEPLSAGGAGNASNDPAPIQDAPAKAGCSV